VPAHQLTTDPFAVDAISIEPDAIGYVKVIRADSPVLPGHMPITAEPSLNELIFNIGILKDNMLLIPKQSYVEY